MVQGTSKPFNKKPFNFLKPFNDFQGFDGFWKILKPFNVISTISPIFEVYRQMPNIRTFFNIYGCLFQEYGSAEEPLAVTLSVVMLSGRAK